MLKEWNSITKSLLPTYPPCRTANPLIPTTSRCPQHFPYPSQHTSWHSFCHTAPASCLHLKQSVRKRAPGEEPPSRIMTPVFLWRPAAAGEEEEAERRTISVQSWQPRTEKMPRSPWGNYKVYMTGEQLLNFVSSSHCVSEAEAF